METFPLLLALSEENSSHKGPMMMRMRIFDVFCVVVLIKLLNKRSRVGLPVILDAISHLMGMTDTIREIQPFLYSCLMWKSPVSGRRRRTPLTPQQRCHRTCQYLCRRQMHEWRASRKNSPQLLQDPARQWRTASRPGKKAETPCNSAVPAKKTPKLHITWPFVRGIQRWQVD